MRTMLTGQRCAKTGQENTKPYGRNYIPSVVILNDLTIIIPAHNEEGSIRRTLAEVTHYMPRSPIIVVCDSCTDRTEIVARRHKNVKTVRIGNKTKGGYKNALMSGLINARTEYVVFCMADNCDDLSRLPLMMYKLQIEKADICCGSRYIKGGGVYSPDSKIKSFVSQFVSVLVHILVGLPTWDGTNAFKMWRRDTLADVIFYDACSKGGFECVLEWTIRAHFKGAKIIEVPIIWTGRTVGKSKFRFTKQAFAYALLVVRGIYWRIQKWIRGKEHQ